MWSKKGVIQITQDMRASAVVTCMGRLAFLKQTLPKILPLFSEYILVDFSCPERSGDWAKENFPGIVLCNVTNKKWFNPSEARNAGANCATLDWIFFIDAEISFTRSPRPFINLQKKDVFYAFRKNFCIGTILCRRDDFLAIGGFNQKLQGYGWEDDDFRIRLQQRGKKETILPPEIIHHIDHTNVIRTKYYEEKNLLKSLEENRVKATNELFRIPESAQRAWELQQFINFLKTRQVRSYIEIGVRHGGTLFRVATALPKGSLIVAVDQPQGAWGADSANNLRNVIDRLSSIGYNAKVVFGNSSSQETIQRVKEISQKFDAAFIDADHRYDSVLKDYKAYSPFCELVAFHDIVGYGCRSGNNLVEVPRLWSEIRSDRHNYEIVEKNSQMGIGILYSGHRILLP